MKRFLFLLLILGISFNLIGQKKSKLDSSMIKDRDVIEYILERLERLDLAQIKCVTRFDSLALSMNNPVSKDSSILLHAYRRLIEIKLEELNLIDP